MTKWTPEQQEVLADLERMSARQYGYFEQDDFAADRCACNHLVYPGDEPGGSCRHELCDCARHESPSRPAGTEGGDPR